MIAEIFRVAASSKCRPAIRRPRHRRIALDEFAYEKRRAQNLAVVAAPIGARYRDAAAGEVCEREKFR